MATKTPKRQFVHTKDEAHEQNLKAALENALKKYAQKPGALKHGFDAALLKLHKL